MCSSDLLALAFIVYTIYTNVVGVTGPYVYFPYLILVWVVIGLALVSFAPGVAARVRSKMAEDDEPPSAAGTATTVSTRGAHA